MSSSLIYRVTKRMMDIVIASVSLGVSWPLICAAGIAVKLDSKGPMFYRGRRVGRRGSPFNLLKLRTMSISPGNVGSQVTSGTDRRITRVGRVLRKTKLDELPQLLNVLKGDVSLVGPRPEAPVYVEKYPVEYQRILSIRPGLSDRATLEFIDEEEVLSASENPEKTYVEEILPRKIKKYLAYVENQSLEEDISIIVETASQVGIRVLRRVIGKEYQ